MIIFFLISDTPEDFFRNCFVEPLATLRQMPDGKGAMVALATALFLFERYWTILPKAERTASRNEQIEQDFKVSADEADVFGQVFRDNLLHLESPMQSGRCKVLPAYSMRPDVARFLEFKDISGVRTLIVYPWMFCDRVQAF